jgi:mannosyltransferase
MLAEQARARALPARLVGSPYAPVALATAAAVALRFPTLAGGSFWLDEWFTHRVLTLPVAAAWQELENTESSPPLYYVLGWGWTRVFGDGEIALRSLSWPFGAATVPVVYLAA